MDMDRALGIIAGLETDMTPEEGFQSPFMPEQEEAIHDIGGDALLRAARYLVARLLHAPPAKFPTKEVLERQRNSLKKALANVSPELRILLRTLHGINSRYYGYGGDLPERFDIVWYLEELCQVSYKRPKGDAMRQQIIMETALMWRGLGLEFDTSRAGDLSEYLGIVLKAVNRSFDLPQLVRDVCKLLTER